MPSSNDAAATGSLEECCWPISECRRKMLLSNRWMLSPAWIAPLWMSLSSAYIFSLVLALLAQPVASYSACSAAACLFDALLYWCWCSLLLTSPLLSSTSSLNSLLIRLTIANCSSTVCISPLFLILAQRCVLKIGLSFATTFFPPNIEQPVVVVIYNQMQTHHHCCGFLELFTAAKNCHEGPRAKRKPLRCAATSFVIPSAGLSPKWMRVMNGHHLHSRLYARSSCPAPF